MVHYRTTDACTPARTTTSRIQQTGQRRGRSLRGFVPRDTFGGIFENPGLLEDLKRIAVLKDLVRKPALSRDGGVGNIEDMKVSLL